MVNKIQVLIKVSSAKVTLEQMYPILFLEGQCPQCQTCMNVFVLLNTKEDILKNVGKRAVLGHHWLPIVYIFFFYIYIYAFSRCFYPKRLTVHSGYNFFCQYVCSLGIEPTTFALLTQCSTTEPQEHYGSHWCPKTVWLQTFFRISSFVFSRTKTFETTWGWVNDTILIFGTSSSLFHPFKH